MITSNYDWKMAASKLDDQQINELAQTLHHSPLLIKILAQRGMETANQIKDFLEPQGQHVHDPYLLYDMEKAIDRIQQAIIENQKIFIYGDYDADGITSTAVMYETLLQLGADVHYFVPDRFKDGYGPNLAEYQNLEAQGMQLLITVDNGVSGYDEVQYLMSLSRITMNCRKNFRRHMRSCIQCIRRAITRLKALPALGLRLKLLVLCLMIFRKKNLIWLQLERLPM